MLRLKRNYRYTTRRFSNYIRAIDFYLVKARRAAYTIKQRVRVMSSGRRASKTKQQYRQCMGALPVLRQGLPVDSVITGFSANKFSKKELSVAKDCFGRVFFFPAFSVYYPGAILYKRQHWANSPHLIDRVGYPIMLGMLPYHMRVSFVYDVTTRKPTYATSYGSFVSRKKDEARTRLLYFKLPSGGFKYFVNKTYAYLACLTNYNCQNFFFGSWGVKWRSRKTLQVRGVAKNPVDHPNGGRAKTKQPERSPWGWVAKRQK